MRGYCLFTYSILSWQYSALDKCNKTTFINCCLNHQIHSKLEFLLIDIISIWFWISCCHCNIAQKVDVSGTSTWTCLYNGNRVCLWFQLALTLYMYACIVAMNCNLNFYWKIRCQYVYGSPWFIAAMQPRLHISFIWLKYCCFISWVYSFSNFSNFRGAPKYNVQQVEISTAKHSSLQYMTRLQRLMASYSAVETSST